MTKKSDQQNKAIERLERELREMRERCAQAESRLTDQSARLDSLGRRREESMRLLAEARADLGRVTRERDTLQKRLVSVEGMQTETVAFSEDEEPSILEAPPSIDELMSSLNLAIEQTGGTSARLSGPAVERPDADWQEMIAPELIAPDGPEEENAPDRAPAAAKAARLLVFLDAAHPIKYPIYKEVMTIGRSESADIQIDGDYISRIHARIICNARHAVIEDAGSRNGLKINSDVVERHSLRHGDVIAIGKLRFTFVEVPGSA